MSVRILKSGTFWLIAIAAIAIVLLWLSSFVFTNWWSPLQYAAPAKSADAVNEAGAPQIPQVTHLPTPAAVKALYMTQCAAASPTLREHLIKLADETEINSIVVDVKDFSGTVIFPSATAVPGGAGCTYADFKQLVKTLHEHNLYVIGRLTVFQDPLYTKVYPEEAVQNVAGGVWRDRKGLSFVDVSSQTFHRYIIALAQEAYELGVDEINFDYVRYPSDGNMAAARYVQTGKSHAENLEKFFADLNSSLHASSSTLQAPVLSVDLFGMTATNYDDLNIGQVLERALPYFDYVSPMVYPSHYPTGFNGWKDVNAHPYDIVFFSLSRAVARTTATSTSISCLVCQPLITSTSSSTLSASPSLYSKPAYNRAKIRPWLQDFNYPVPYTAEMVKAQMEATYAAGLNSWMLWDPANKYTRSALLTEE